MGGKGMWMIVRADSFTSASPQLGDCTPEHRRSAQPQGEGGRPPVAPREILRRKDPGATW